MRANRSTRRGKILAFIAGALMTSVLVPALHAQLRLGGSRPALLTPRRAAPAQSGNAAQGARQPAPKPALNLTLVDPGPIGIQTSGASFSLAVPAGGTKVLTATPVNSGDPLKSGWARVDFGTSTIYFAHIAVGQGWSTIFTVMNTGSAPIEGTLVLTGQDGNPLTVTGNDASPTLGNPDDRIALAGGLSGVATFQLTEGGTLKSVAGVLESPRVQFATIPVDDDAGSEQFTGYAVANPGSQPVTVKLALVDQNGTVVEDITPAALNPLGPGRQVARFLFQDLPARTTFRGSLVLRAQGTGTIVPVALVSKKGLVSAVPVIPEKAPNIPN